MNPLRRLVPTRPWLLMAAFTVAVMATSAREALRLYEDLGSGWSWDLAYYNQWFHALTLGDGTITVNPIGPLTTEGPSIWRMNYLTPIRLAIAPVYWMVPGPRTLLVLHAVVFWMTIPAAFGLVRSETGSGWVALSAAILVPLTPLLSPLAVNDFRELQLAIPFVLWAMHGVRERDIRLTVLGVGGLLACRQECALVVALLAFLPPRVPEGIVRRDRWMLGLWLTGLGWVLFGFLTYAKWFVNSQAWAISFEQVGSSIPLGMRMETLGGLVVVGLGSWALLACLAPRAGVLAVPWAWKVAGGLFAIRLLGTESWAHVRYTSPMVATGLAAGCLGYARLTNWLRPKGPRFVAGAWVVVALGLLPADWTLLGLFANAPRPFTKAEAREIRTWIDRVGSDDGVLAHYDVCAPLSSRQTLYSYVMTNNEPPGFPDALGPEIRWVFVRTREIERAQGTFDRQGFRLVYGGDSLRVYRRDRPKGPRARDRAAVRVRSVPSRSGARIVKNCRRT